mgnify:CR=1 FL=1
MMVGQKNFIKMRYRPMPPLEELKEFLDYNPDTGIFTWIKKPNRRIKVGQVAGRAHGNGYIRIRFKGIDYFAHRLAYYMYHGVDPLENLVDHKYGDGSNNEIKNLRLATTPQNGANRVNLNRNNTSGVIGVCWHKRFKKWQAQIIVNKVYKYLGSFTNKEDAIKARREAEIKYFGDFRGKV